MLRSHLLQMNLEMVLEEKEERWDGFFEVWFRSRLEDMLDGKGVQGEKGEVEKEMAKKRKS